MDTINEKIFKGFKQGKFSISCKTENEAKSFLNYCEKQNLRWMNGDKANTKTHWDKEDNLLFYMLGANGIHCCTSNIFKMKEKTYEDLITLDLSIDNYSYTGLEILHMIKEDKIKIGQEFTIYEHKLSPNSHIGKWTGENFKISFANNSYTLSVYDILLAEFYIQKDYVTFDEARKSGKLFKYKEWHTFHKLPVILQLLANKATNEDVSSLLDEKVWEIQKN